MIFLMHFRSMLLIVSIPLLLAVLLSFLGMHYAGIWSNITRLAGTPQSLLGVVWPNNNRYRRVL